MGFHGNGARLNQYTCVDTGGTVESAKRFCTEKPECIGFDWRAHAPRTVCWYRGGDGTLGGGGTWDTDAYFLMCRLPQGSEPPQRRLPPLPPTTKSATTVTATTATDTPAPFVTSLSTAILAGATTMEVASVEGFEVGDALVLAAPDGSPSEAVVIASFGSLVLQQPTIHTYPAGSTVTKTTARAATKEQSAFLGLRSPRPLGTTGTSSTALSGTTGASIKVHAATGKSFIAFAIVVVIIFSAIAIILVLRRGRQEGGEGKVRPGGT